MFTCALKYTSTLTILYWKCYWLFYLSVHSLSPDNAMENGRKRNSVKMQPRKVKIKINLKASWGPFSQNKFGGPREVSPAPPPLSGPGSRVHPGSHQLDSDVHSTQLCLTKESLGPTNDCTLGYSMTFFYSLTFQSISLFQSLLTRNWNVASEMQRDLTVNGH